MFPLVWLHFSAPALYMQCAASAAASHHRPSLVPRALPNLNIHEKLEVLDELPLSGTSLSTALAFRQVFPCHYLLLSNDPLSQSNLCGSCISILVSIRSVVPQAGKHNACRSRCPTYRHHPPVILSYFSSSCP